MVQILHHLQMHGLLDPWNVCILNLEKWILRFPVHLFLSYTNSSRVSKGKNASRILQKQKEGNITEIEDWWPLLLAFTFRSPDLRSPGFDDLKV